MSRNPENNRFPISAQAVNDSMLIKYFIVLCFQIKVRENYTANKEMTARYRHKHVIQWSQVKKTCTENLFVYLRIFFTYHFIYIFFFMV